MDDPSTHSGGYSSGLTGTLDKDVTAVEVDFKIDAKNDFSAALGYSKDHDPSFRYCAETVTTNSGVPDYTNLWMNKCSLTGGASCGSWLIDMNQLEVGTVVLVNSWGYTDRKGMTGPNLQTSSGSNAECLFNKAKTVEDPGSVGGYIVDC